MINGNQVIMKVIELLMLLIAVVSLITYLPITTAAKGTSKPFIRHWVRAAQKYSTARVVTIVCSDHTEKKDFLKLMKAPQNNTFKFVSNISGGRGFPGNNGLFIICEDDWPNVSTSLFAQENPVTFSGTVILLANKSNSSISGLFTNTYPQPRIDQEFYVLNADTGCMNEAYFLAKDFLVYDELICASEAEGIFRFISKTPLLQRRNNFRGVKLRMLTENDGTNIKLHQDVLKSTSRPQGHPDDLFRISKSQISGAFYDLLVILEQEMNFTAELFLRNRRSWGTYNFTSKKAMGMLLNAERGEVDLIFSTYSMTAERNQVVKWLFPIVTETMAIFVAKTEWKKKIPWLLYVYPFAMDLWCFLLGNLFLVASMLVVLRRATAVVTRSKNVPNWNYGLLLWTVFCSYFGMKPTGISEGDTTHQHASPVRIVIFTMALVGTVVFMSYRAALTSELSVGLVKPPFSDLQEFLDSEYYLLNPTENFYTRRLQNSKEGSIHRQLFESKRLPVTDNMDHDLFIPHLLSRENTAYYVPSEVVSGFGSKACGIYAPYKEMYPNLASVAFPKKSPFYQFFQSRLLMLVQNGQWDIIKRRLSTANCKDSKADEDNSSTSMGIGKLSFLFSIIGFGYFCACLVFAQELLRARAKTTSVGQKLHGSCVVRGHEGKRDLI